MTELELHFTGQGYGALKQEVADVVVAAMEPVQARYSELIKDKGYLESVLKDGADAAQQRAYKMLSKVYRKAGFVEHQR